MQQRNEILKYVLDIESIIVELEKIIEHHKTNFQEFQANFISIRAVERDLIIIGEAIVKLMKFEKEIKISSAKHIIGLRNLIVHAYDSIEPAALWRILIVDLPILKHEIYTIKTTL